MKNCLQNLQTGSTILIEYRDCSLPLQSQTSKNKGDF